MAAGVTTIGDCTIHCGDALAVLRTLPSGMARCCVTSPPYWGLRDYGHEGQLGLEPTPAEYVAGMVAVFSEVRRVLTDDGTLWLNLGDSYNAYNGGAGPSAWKGQERRDGARPKLESGFGLRDKGLKPKDLVGIPWSVAFALRADGWYLRSDIIWAKPSPMPESVTDRPTKSHEYLFLLTKSDRYFYDAKAIAERCFESNAERPRMGQGPNTEYKQKRQSVAQHKQADLGRSMKASSLGYNGDFGTRNKRTVWTVADATALREWLAKTVEGSAMLRQFIAENGNKPSVWTVATTPYSEAHFATFPPKLIEPCILAGSAKGDTVLDTFAGTATTGLVAEKHGRKFIGIELNPKYITLAKRRLRKAKYPETAVENFDGEPEAGGLFAATA